MERCWSGAGLLVVAFSSLMCAAPGGIGDGDGDGDVDVGNGTGAAPSSGGSNANDDIISIIPPIVENPCESDDAPEICELEAPPACGDGEINLDPPEQCDDGNSLPGDGCSGACTVEPFFDCPTPGEPCVSTINCGDGVIEPGEACDDSNQVGGDLLSVVHNALIQCAVRQQYRAFCERQRWVCQSPQQPG